MWEGSPNSWFLPHPDQFSFITCVLFSEGRAIGASGVRPRGRPEISARRSRRMLS